MAPATTCWSTVSGFGVIAAGATLLIGSGGTQVVRDVTAAPAPLADLDSPLPAAFTTNLGVERLTVDPGSERQGASAPLARIRVTFGGRAAVRRQRRRPRRRTATGCPTRARRSSTPSPRCAATTSCCRTRRR